jgi:hypothetical protein
VLRARIGVAGQTIDDGPHALAQLERDPVLLRISTRTSLIDSGPGLHAVNSYTQLASPCSSCAARGTWWGPTTPPPPRSLPVACAGRAPAIGATQIPSNPANTSATQVAPALTMLAISARSLILQPCRRRSSGAALRPASWSHPACSTQLVGRASEAGRGNLGVHDGLNLRHPRGGGAVPPAAAPI